MAHVRVCDEDAVNESDTTGRIEWRAEEHLALDANVGRSIENCDRPRCSYDGHA